MKLAATATLAAQDISGGYLLFLFISINFHHQHALKSGRVHFYVTSSL